MIYAIYSPNERPIIQPLLDKLNKDYDVFTAPVGLEAGSAEWKKIVEQDIKKCTLILILATEKSVTDETVAWRLKVAINNMPKHIFPLFLASQQHSLNDKKPHPDLEILERFNIIRYFDEEEETIDHFVEDISSRAEIWGLKKTIKLNCFISYSRSESEFATKITKDLKRTSIKTWYDKENIPPGANWDKEIEKGIKECTHLLLIASPRSVASENVQDEISYALNNDKSVIPLIIEECDLPMRVHRAQWVDFQQDYKTAFKSLIERLGAS